MLVYRVCFYDPTAKKGKSGHPEYLHKPQGKSRWDNPDLYDSWYVAMSPEGAIGETFGNLERWTPRMFETGTRGLRRALATFSVPDDLAVFDFDNATNLESIGMRPSEVVIRNTPATQRRAAALFNERNPNGSRRWAALQWWSYHYPRWTNLFLWSTATEAAPLTFRRIDDLDLTSPEIVEAAEALRRPLT